MAFSRLEVPGMELNRHHVTHGDDEGYDYHIGCLKKESMSGD